jgi:hypothetical protein
VWENQKWNGDSLYQKFATDKRFRPQIFVMAGGNDNLNFFKNRGYDVVDVTDGNLENHKIDIVFYQQPWFSLEGPNTPASLSERALCLYFPYSVTPIFDLPNTWNKCGDFLKSQAMVFVFNSTIKKTVKELGLKNVVVSGHPKMDAYAGPIKNNPWKSENKRKIIYAPHHSFSEWSLNWGTFRWNGRRILELAKQNVDTSEWIFKPHPWFKGALIDFGIMLEEEVANYYEEWRKVGQIYDMGDYFDIFRTSDLMITDCGSFLLEYMPTANPVMHLCPPPEEKPFDTLVHEEASKHYYKVKTIKELEEVFDMLVNKREDPMSGARRKDAAMIGFDSAANIYNFVRKMIK